MALLTLVPSYVSMFLILEVLSDVREEAGGVCGVVRHG